MHQLEDGIISDVKYLVLSTYKIQIKAGGLFPVDICIMQINDFYITSYETFQSQYVCVSLITRRKDSLEYLFALRIRVD